MKPEQRNFVRYLLRTMMNMGLARLIWKMPWQATVVLVLLCILAIVYFGLY